MVSDPDLPGEEGRSPDHTGWHITGASPRGGQAHPHRCPASRRLGCQTLGKQSKGDRPPSGVEKGPKAEKTLQPPLARVLCPPRAWEAGTGVQRWGVWCLPHPRSWCQGGGSSTGPAGDRSAGPQASVPSTPAWGCPEPFSHPEAALPARDTRLIILLMNRHTWVSLSWAPVHTHCPISFTRGSHLPSAWLMGFRSRPPTPGRGEGSPTGPMVMSSPANALL